MAVQAPSEVDDCLQFIAPDGSYNADAIEALGLEDDTLRGIYETMVRAREFDNRAMLLQRQGKLPIWIQCFGQEATQVGSAFALKERDWIATGYRQHGAHLSRRRSMADIYSFFFRGYETWSEDAIDNEGYPDPPEGNRRLPETTALGTQMPQSVGLMWGRKYQGYDEVGLVYHGDGSTSTGDFHEGLNFAGVFDIPLVFLCENNGWAISIPRERQTASETIAQKATAYGFDGQIVDGNDALAVYAATADALEKARSDLEPTLIEALTYRRGAHTTSDDPSVYRDEEEVEFWQERDPIDRYEVFLEDLGLWEESYAEEVRAAADNEAQEAAQKALERAEQQTYEEIFDEVYDEPTPRLAEQQAELEELLEKYGEDAFREE